LGPTGRRAWPDAWAKRRHTLACDLTGAGLALWARWRRWSRGWLAPYSCSSSSVCWRARRLV